jgi:hypothetical protein
MAEISNKCDNINDASNVTSCPLARYGCKEDQEVVRKKIQTCYILSCLYIVSII